MISMRSSAGAYPIVSTPRPTGWILYGIVVDGLKPHFKLLFAAIKWREAQAVKRGFSW